ncbi:MAG: glycosyltransferase family 9 protein [Bryobacteraceae bacterium]
MNQTLERLPHGAHVAVIRLRSLGDCVLTTPALTLLKAHRPDLQIAVVVEDRFAAVFDGNPGISRILAPTAAAISAWHPQLVLNAHGGSRSMLLTIASRARLRAGWAHHTWSAAYNVRIPRAQEILNVDRVVHTAEHVASAMFYLGVPQSAIPRAVLFADPQPTRSPYAVIHAFASAAEKAWPAERFRAVASHLKATGLEPVFLCGPADDASPFHDFECLRGSLGRAKSLLKDASLFVGNDSGPAHMAAAFGVPVVVLFGPSDPSVWAPWRTESRTFSNLGVLSEASVIAAAEELRAKVKA